MYTVDSTSCKMRYCNKCDKYRRELQKYKETGLSPEEIIDGKLLAGWILPEERLPDEEQEVLVSTAKYVCLVEYNSDYGFGEVDGVLAWMPLPEIYKRED